MDGTRTYFAFPPFPEFRAGRGITVGPDGNMWFTETLEFGQYDAIGKLTPGGVRTEFRLTRSGAPGGITAGPDGNLWFPSWDKIGRITPDGAISYFPLPNTGGSATGAITTGPDGNLWFTVPYINSAFGGDRIVKLGLPGPRVSNVSSTNPDGVYTTGASIAITVTFSTPVNVGGLPTLTLNSGGIAVYASGSGTNTLTFSYSVQALESTSRLDAAITIANLLTNLPGQVMAIGLNGGTVRDSVGNDAILLLPAAPAAGSLGANKQIAINPPDGTPPVSAVNSLPGPNANGWNKSDVTVTVTASDGSGSGVKQIRYVLSGAQSAAAQVVSGSSASVTVSSEGVTYITYFATDNVGNVEAAKTLTVRLDKTGPTLAFGAASPSANAAGWNNSNVSIPFVVSDALSGVETTSASSPLALTAEGNSLSAPVTVTDQAGNSATFTSPAVKIDRTPPTISGARSPEANANGWNNTPVRVSFSCMDSLSGLAATSPPADAVLSADGAAQSVNGRCEDAAGNSASVGVTGINIDRTSPTAVAFALPAANANGWNNNNVTVSVSGADSLSGIDSCTAPVVLTAEGSGQSATGMCTDKAGNVSAPAIKTGINIDKTAPVLQGSRSPAANANGWNNSDVTVAFTCSDALAGVAAVSPGAAVVISSEGANQSVPGSCQDVAGNVASVVLAAINIDKTQPVVTDVTADPGTVPLNGTFTVKATVTDSRSGPASAEYSLNNGPFTALTLTDIGAGLWTASVPGPAAGVYSVCVRSADKAGNQADSTCTLVAVYDPNGGFVTGGGWITSAPGAYVTSPSLTGKANFAFTSKYQNGANVPSGDTQFQFQTGNLIFKSTAYEWLVVAGARAQFKGAGTINGAGSYDFLLTAIDGQMPGGGGVDKFRIKIWNAGGIVYDNQAGADDAGNSATALGGGSIVIHQ